MAPCQYNLDVSPALRYVLGTVNTIQGLVAFIGNMIVFFVVLGNKRLRTRSNLCLLSLASTDLLVGLIVEPMHALQLFAGEYRANCTFNSIRRYLSTVFMGASISSIVLVSYDRYLRLSKTMNYKEHMTKKKIALLLTLCWLIPVMIPFVRYTSETIYSAIILVYVTAVVTAMILCYYFIVRIIKRRTDSLKEGGNVGKYQTQVVKSHIKVSKAIAVIIICLLITFAPVSIFHGITAICALASRKATISTENREICYAVLMTIGLANSAMNPAIYYLRIPEFRNTFKSVAGKIFRRLSGRDYASTSRDSKDNKSSDTAL